MDLEQLRTKRNDLAAKMQAILDAAGEDDLSKEQAAAFDVAEVDFKRIDAMVKRAEAMQGVNERLNELRPSTGARQVGDDPIDPPGGPEAVKEFESFGEFIHSVRFRQSDQRLEYHEQDLKGEHRMDDGPSGGFAVPEQFRAEILMIEQAPGVVRPRATVIPPGTPPDARINLLALDQTSARNMFGGVTVTWIGEGATKPEANAKLREISLQPHEVAAHVVVTDKLLRNWQSAGPFLSELLGKARIASEDQEFIDGDGVAKPLGFIGHASSINVARTTANTVKFADIAKMEGELLSGGGMPIWLTSGKVVPELRKMEDTEGHLIWSEGSSPADVAAKGRPSTLLGMPIIRHQRMPKLGVKGDLVLVDLSRYLIKDGSGPFVAASPHVFFRDNKTVIKMFWNTDGQPWLTEPLEEENGETFSPFVILDVPAA